MRRAGPVLIAFGGAALAACGSQVVLETVRPHGGGGASASSASGSAISAVGPDAAGATATANAVASSSGAGDCANGQPTASCEKCVGPVLTCQPDEACVHDGVVCGGCLPSKDALAFPPYLCKCMGGGEDLPPHFDCMHLPSCCVGDGQKPNECGDAAVTRCVAHRCVFAPPPRHVLVVRRLPRPGLRRGVVVPVRDEMRPGRSPRRVRSAERLTARPALRRARRHHTTGTGESCRPATPVPSWPNTLLPQQLGTAEGLLTP